MQKKALFLALGCLIDMVRSLVPLAYHPKHVHVLVGQVLIVGVARTLQWSLFVFGCVQTEDDAPALFFTSQPEVL